MRFSYPLIQGVISNSNGPFGGRARRARACWSKISPPIVRAVRQGLEEEGFAVDVATDGEEGDIKCRTTSYDVIVLDIMLPEGGRPDAPETLARRPASPPTF